MASKSNAAPAADNDADDYKAQSDADTLQRAAEIQQDDGRHGKASKHLAKRAKAATTAHQMSRDQLEKKTTSRLKKTFGKK
jgi:hypothetical protein